MSPMLGAMLGAWLALRELFPAIISAEAPREHRECFGTLTHLVGNGKGTCFGLHRLLLGCWVFFLLLFFPEFLLVRAQNFLTRWWITREAIFCWEMGSKKPPLPLAMKEINRFTGGEWDTLFRAFQKFLKLEGCYFLIGLRPGKGNMVSEQEAEGNAWGTGRDVENCPTPWCKPGVAWLGGVLRRSSGFNKTG